METAMAKAPNLNDLSWIKDLEYGQLTALKETAEEQINSRKAQAKEELRNEFAEKARQYGFTVEELLTAKRKGSKGAVAPKYRDPEHPQLTWAGRGRMPKWLQERVDNGAKLEEFAIQ